MATVKSKIIVRKGPLADLPILDAGEQGYAIDANRLFIGNTPVLRTGDGVTTDFNFGVDLGIEQTDIQTTVDSGLTTDSNPVGYETPIKYILKVNGLTQNINQDYVVKGDGRTVSFAVAPAENASVELYYNTELLTYTQEDRRDLVTNVQLQGNATDVDISEITISDDRATNSEVSYTITNNVNNTKRKGVLSITLTDTSFFIDDKYTTDDDASVPHEFNGILSNGVFVLNYTTASADEATFSFIAKNWKS